MDPLIYIALFLLAWTALAFWTVAKASRIGVRSTTDAKGAEARARRRAFANIR
ncbi:MAG TPA: hypothetical protein VHE30_24720 [Polyangiaceae bacterium]|nr:hypothetical protein [Polyangiaceae bacterium]